MDIVREIFEYLNYVITIITVFQILASFFKKKQLSSYLNDHSKKKALLEGERNIKSNESKAALIYANLFNNFPDDINIFNKYVATNTRNFKEGFASKYNDVDFELLDEVVSEYNTEEINQYVSNKYLLKNTYSKYKTKIFHNFVSSFLYFLPTIIAFMFIFILNLNKNLVFGKFTIVYAYVILIFINIFQTIDKTKCGFYVLGFTKLIFSIFSLIYFNLELVISSLSSNPPLFWYIFVLLCISLPFIQINIKKELIVNGRIMNFFANISIIFITFILYAPIFLLIWLVDIIFPITIEPIYYLSISGGLIMILYALLDLFLNIKRINYCYVTNYFETCTTWSYNTLNCNNKQHISSIYFESKYDLVIDENLENITEAYFANSIEIKSNLQLDKLIILKDCESIKITANKFIVDKIYFANDVQQCILSYINGNNEIEKYTIINSNEQFKIKNIFINDGKRNEFNK